MTTFAAHIATAKPLMIRKGRVLSFDFDTPEQAQTAYERLIAELRAAVDAPKAPTGERQP